MAEGPPLVDLSEVCDNQKIMKQEVELYTDRIRR
jgi:hypothetical protein